MFHVFVVILILPTVPAFFEIPFVVSTITSFWGEKRDMANPRLLLRNLGMKIRTSKYASKSASKSCFPFFAFSQKLLIIETKDHERNQRYI